jgi:hypothetical protein
MGFLKKMFGGDDDQPAAGGAATPVNTRDPEVMINRLLSLQPGDSLSYMGRRWDVTGWIDYDEGGYRWREFHLKGDGEEYAALSVDPKGNPKAIIWQYDGNLTPNPGVPQIDREGVTYKANSHGAASFHTHGTVDAPPSGMIEYYDYHLHDRNKMIAFQRCNDHSWETYRGERVELQYISLTPQAG